ncbi:MAG: tetratricopeptide repeat protein [Candidatus Korobacteraceae bacterium]
MNSRSCRWLVWALLITASGAWAQQSAPPASDQKVIRSWEATVRLFELQCRLPTAFDQKSIAAFKQQAASGDAVAQCGLGRMYSLGKGVPEDYAQAAFWYRKAAEQGNAHAQCNLGLMLVLDTGLRQASALGYALGSGVPQNVPQNDEALLWFRKAAEQGDAKAQMVLGALYSGGQGVPQDKAQAVLWTRKAAEQGNAQAQLTLGTAYGAGLGVPQNFAEAYFWFEVAMAGKLDASDMELAAKLKRWHASMLTPADISREQERARKWLEDHPTKPQ